MADVVKHNASHTADNEVTKAEYEADDHHQITFDSAAGHDHDGASGGKKVSHNNLTNVTSDQHHARSHDHSLAADGSPIAVSGVPDLPASKITSGRFTLARLPDGTLNYVLKAQGAGVDPLYAQVAHSELTGIGASDHHVKTGDDEVTGLIASGLDANRPAAGVGGRMYYATDTDKLYRDNGTSWEVVAVMNLADLAEKSHASLTSVTADQHHAKLHASDHLSTGADPLSLTDSEIAAGAGIVESKLSLNYPTHAENHKARHVSGGADAFAKGDILLAAVRYLEGVSPDPASDALRIWLASGGSEIRYWDDLATPVKRILVATDLTQTLTNKTIDAAQNTLSGIGSGEVSTDLITGQVEDTIPDGAADYVLSYDASAAALKKVLMNNLPGGGGAGTQTVRIPITLLNPRVSSLAGNSFFTVTGLTAWDAGHWEFVKDVDGKIYGIVHVPNNLNATPNAKIILTIAANATSGVTRLSVATNPPADGESLDPASLTAETAQDITVPATARLRKDVTFTLTNAPAANDILIVEITHEGSHANDTLAVNTELYEAVLEVVVNT